MNGLEPYTILGGFQTLKSITISRAYVRRYKCKFFGHK